MRNYRKYFIQFITEIFPIEYADIISKTDKHFSTISIDTAFAKTSKNPIDKRLDFSAYFLALIKTLDEKGESFDNIRQICLQIVKEFVQPKNKLKGVFKKLLPKLTNTWVGQVLFKKLHKKISHNANSGGFVANIITDKAETFGLGYGIDIVECGICKLFQKHNYSKYASILCEVDEITSSLAGLQLIRSGTIAKGAKKCDFRFKRVN
jgi:hypothetical protein